MGLFGKRREVAADPTKATAKIALWQLPGSAVAALEREGGVEAGSWAQTFLLMRQARAVAVNVTFYDSGGWRTDAAPLNESVMGIDAATTDWEGDPKLLQLLPPALLDKLLVNLSSSRAEAEAFLARVSTFVTRRRSVRFGGEAEGTVDPFSGFLPILGLGDIERETAEALARESGPGEQVIELLLRSGTVSDPLAQVICEVIFMPERSRLGATTKFRPRRATNEQVAELAFWGLWDWVCLAMQAWSRNQSHVGPEILMNCVAHQCSIYESRGLPTLRSAGAAPFEAVTSIPILAMAMGIPLVA